MRLDEWQRWLDSQFLDDETEVAPEEARTEIADTRPTPAGDEPPAPALLPAALPVNAEPTLLPPPVRPEPVAPRSLLAPIVKNAVERPVASSPVGEMDVPEIENYLPFLRKQQEPAVAAQASAVEPPEPATNEPSTPLLAAASAAPQQEPPEPPEPEEVPVAQAAAEAAASGGERTAEVAAQPTTAAKPARPAYEPPPSPLPADPVRSAPAARRARQVRTAEAAMVSSQGSAAPDIWRLAPRGIDTLLAMGSDDSVQNSYKRAFKESRIELISRLLDPTLSLEETARLLNVCPTTVRRYTQRGLLQHQRTKGDQRRFKLSDVLGFLEAQSQREQ